MNTPRPHPPIRPTDDRSKPASHVAMDRALDRRHQLDEQQRAIRDAVPRPHFTRPRPM